MTSMKPVTFKYANEDCQSVRGTLITISDQVEQGGSCASIGFDLPECALVTWKFCGVFFVFFVFKLVQNHKPSCICVSDFITTLLPRMTNMDRIWIGLKIHLRDMEWLDQAPVEYVNFNPLLVGMQRVVRVNVSLTSLDKACWSVPQHMQGGVAGTHLRFNWGDHNLLPFWNLFR